MSGFVECLAESTQTPEEMGGVLALGVLATALQSKFTVEVTPDWKEPLCLYTVAVAQPGERKSAVFSALTAPLKEWETQMQEQQAEAIEQNRMEKELLEKSRAAAATAAVKKHSEEHKLEAMELSAKLANFKELHPCRLLVDDVTPEKLADLMDQQEGCITLSSAEGGVFDSMTGRYDKGANFDVYLKGHAGDMIVVDRIGRKANSIRNPRLSMMLAIQPDVLNGLMNNATFKGRGLCGRFLYALCASKVGRRQITPEPIPQRVKTDYQAFVRRLLEMPYRGIIRLSGEADALRQGYQATIEERLGKEWEHMRDWGGKATGAMLRIAALFHGAEVQGDPTQIPISGQTLMAACKVTEFFAVHAEAAYQRMGSDPATENARYILSRIVQNGKDRLDATEVNDLCRKLKSEERKPALDILMERGYLREEQEDIGYRGRARTVYRVNPAAF